MMTPIKTYKVTATYRDFEPTVHEATSHIMALLQRFPDSDFIKYQHSGRDAFKDHVYAVRDGKVGQTPIASVLTVNVYEMPTPDHKMILWSHLDNGKWRLPHQIMTVEEIKALLDSTRQQIADQGRIVDDRLLSTVKMLERALEENEDE